MGAPTPLSQFKTDTSRRGPGAGPRVSPAPLLGAGGFSSRRSTDAAGGFSVEGGAVVDDTDVAHRPLTFRNFTPEWRMRQIDLEAEQRDRDASCCRREWDALDRWAEAVGDCFDPGGAA